MLGRHYGRVLELFVPLSQNQCCLLCCPMKCSATVRLFQQLQGYAHMAGGGGITTTIQLRRRQRPKHAKCLVEILSDNYCNIVQHPIIDGVKSLRRLVGDEDGSSAAVGLPRNCSCADKVDSLGPRAPGRGRGGGR